MGAFADRLWRLKREAGDPSYAEMAARLGAAASKSSLAAAAQGRALPSWEVTWEFVRVLAVDRLGRDRLETEKQWRELWSRAHVGRPAEPAGEPSPGPEPALPAAAASTGAEGSGQKRESYPEPKSRRRMSVAAVAVVAALVGAGAGFLYSARQQAGPAEMPVPGHDDSRFEGDVTYPDGTLVPPNSSFTKVWRLRNTGTVVWTGRFLARANEQPCEAPERVPIPQTRPGETVEISVPVRTPDRPATCKIYWKMVDARGLTYFPAKRPVFLDVRVGEG